MTDPGDKKTLSTTNARQGRTGLGVRYVLIIGLVAVIVGFLSVYVYLFGA